MKKFILVLAILALPALAEEIEQFPFEQATTAVQVATVRKEAIDLRNWLKRFGTRLDEKQVGSISGSYSESSFLGSGSGSGGFRGVWNENLVKAEFYQVWVASHKELDSLIEAKKRSDEKWLNNPNATITSYFADEAETKLKVLRRTTVDFSEFEIWQSKVKDFGRHLDLLLAADLDEKETRHIERIAAWASQSMILVDRYDCLNEMEYREEVTSREVGAGTVSSWFYTRRVVYDGQREFFKKNTDDRLGGYDFQFPTNQLRSFLY